MDIMNLCDVVISAKLNIYILLFTINITLGFVENDFVFREGKVIIFVLMQLLVGIPRCDPC